MTDPGREERQPVHEGRIESACPTCDGALVARFTPRGIWTWCGACRRLAPAFVVTGPKGPVFVHPAAAA